MAEREAIVKDTSKTEKAVNVVKSSFGWIGVGLIAASYLVFSFLTISEKDASIMEIILRTATSFLVGFSINRMLDIQGINAGLSTPDFIAVDKEHFTATKELGRDRTRLRRYTNHLNKEGLKDARTTILSYEGLSYEEYFDEKGKFIGKFGRLNKDMDKFKKAEITAHNNCLKRAISHKITQLSPQSLLSDDVKVLDPNYQGQTIGEYTKKSVGYDIVAKLAPAFIVGRIGVGFVGGASAAAFIFALLEISLYVLMGFIKYYGAFRFITKSYKGRIINKTLQLQGIKDWVDPEEVKNNGENKTTGNAPEATNTSRYVEGTTTDPSTVQLQTGTTHTSGTVENEQTTNTNEQTAIRGAVLLNE